MRAAIIAVVALSGCVLPQVVPEALNTEFKPTGEIRMHGHSSSFDAVRVRSTKMNISKRTDGSWGGSFDDRAVDVSVSDDTVRGVDLLLSRRESTSDHLIITGQFQGRIYRFEFDANHALARTPNTSMTLPGRQIGENQTTFGPSGELTLVGEAGREAPPWPQMAFALIAAFSN